MTSRSLEIGARMDRGFEEARVEVAEIEAAAQVESAAAEATVVATILDSGDGQDQEPVIFDAPPPAEPEPDPTDDAAPPPVEDSHEPADDKPRKHGLGMW